MNKRTGYVLFPLFLAFFLVSVVLSCQAAALEIHQKIQGPFTSSADVTAACLKCHHQQAVEVLQSTHWTWVRQRAVNGKNTLYGKKDSLTGFAIDVSSNPSRCMGCHVSNTRPDVDFNAPRPEMVDCLVCHDTTGTYRQADPGVPANHSRQELELMTRNVGTPTPGNCMTCHFADCDLPSADQSRQTSPGNRAPSQDIHMDRAATAFTCQDCHLRHSGHSFSRKMGRVNGSSPGRGCASCHTSVPHTIDQLNQHMATIACQTCHIPQYAQKSPVIISWNWIMTGKANRVYQNRSQGRIMVQDENGFSSATQMEPVYLWDDGGDRVYTRGQRIRPRELTYLQRPSERTPDSKITPFRVIYGTQMYDTKYRYLISPLLQPTGSTFFPGSDWDAVARQGMQAIVLPFSGQYAFAPTAALRRINHGVVPAAKAFGCIDCHGRTSPMPWEELGYDQDPWSGNALVNRKSERLGPELTPEPQTKLQPVEELSIPPGSSF
jgi:octaheme c-type cytochrome (tetrathionate reductase family)